MIWIPGDAPEAAQYRRAGDPALAGVRISADGKVKRAYGTVSATDVFGESWEPHAETCSCALCVMARGETQPTYKDVWSGNPDTDKTWSK